MRADGTRLSAGELAKRNRLTSGAITHILDRLERRRFGRRERDAADRRKVLVHVRVESRAALIPKYEALGEAFMALLDQYREDELRLIADYMENASLVSRRELEKPVAARRRPEGRRHSAGPGECAVDPVEGPRSKS